MSLLASLAILPAVLLMPQGETTPATPPAAQQKPALLQPAEQATLRTKLVKYLEADQHYEIAEGSKDREKASGKREKAKKDLQDAWDATKKKGNLLGSMADLRAIYDNCFVVKPATFSLATLKKDTAKVSETESYDYSIYLPKAYKADKPWRTMVVLPGTVAADQVGKWVEGREYFKQVWDKSPSLADTIFHMCHLPDGLEMDGPPDFSREGQEAEEGRRIAAVFSTFLGQTVAQIANVDRSRVFLDCGRGNCGFGVRFVSMFPDRFAGLVLRQPIAVDELRLGSLLGMPVLMIQTAATATVVEALKKRLEALTPGSVKVVEVTDEYPHASATAAIETWMAAQRRNMCPSRVVIEPNHDLFRRAYWVRMGRMDPLHTAAADEKARIEVQADPVNNRIVVTARGVENFTLLLNDDLVDLEKPFTVVINEKAVGPEKRTRDATGMQKRVLERGDWEFLFPVEFNSTVPKAVVEKADEKKGSAPPADEKK